MPVIMRPLHLVLHNVLSIAIAIAIAIAVVFAAAAPGEELLSADAWMSPSIFDNQTVMTSKLVPVTGVPGNQAYRLEVKQATTPEWDAQYQVTIPQSIAVGDAIELRIWLRSVAGPGKARIMAQEGKEPWGSVVAADQDLTPQWKECVLNGVASQAWEAAGWRVILHLGFRAQQIEVGPIALSRRAAGRPPAPRSTVILPAQVMQPPPVVQPTVKPPPAVAAPDPVAAPDDGQLASQLFGPDPLSALYLNSPQTIRVAPAPAPPKYRQARRLTAHRNVANPWDALVSIPLTQPIHKGRKYTLKCVFRAAPPTTEANLGLKLQRNEDPYPATWQSEPTARLNWRDLGATFTAEIDLREKSDSLMIMLGKKTQTVDLGEVSLDEAP